MSVSATTFVNFQHNVAKEKHLSIKSDSEIRRTTLFFKVLKLSFFFFFLIENFKHTKTSSILKLGFEWEEQYQRQVKQWKFIQNNATVRELTSGFLPTT